MKHYILCFFWGFVLLTISASCGSPNSGGTRARTAGLKTTDQVAVQTPPEKQNGGRSSGNNGDNGDNGDDSDGSTDTDPNTNSSPHPDTNTDRTVKVTGLTVVCTNCGTGTSSDSDTAIFPGAGVQLQAKAIRTDGTTLAVSNNAVLWTSDDRTVIAVNPTSGIATVVTDSGSDTDSGTDVGTDTDATRDVTITAAFLPEKVIKASIVLTVAELKSIAVTAEDASLDGSSRKYQFTAMGTFEGGLTHEIDDVVVWSATPGPCVDPFTNQPCAPRVSLNIDTAGLGTCSANGESNVKALFGGIAGTLLFKCDISTDSSWWDDTRGAFESIPGAFGL